MSDGIRTPGEGPVPVFTRDEMARILTEREEALKEDLEKYKDRWTTACVENERLKRRVNELESESLHFSSPEHPVDGITPKDRATARGRLLDRYAFTESSLNVRLWTGYCIMTMRDRETAKEMADRLDTAFWELRSEVDAKEGEEYTDREYERCMKLRREHPERFEDA